MALVEVRDLRRTFMVRPRRAGLLGALRDLAAGPMAELHALDGVSFEVEAGEIVGYIGPNGAGKSTTIKCLTGIFKPTSGSVRVAGLDPWADRRQHVRHIGVVFGQRTQLWWDLAVQEAYNLLAAVFDVPTADYRRRLGELTELLDLAPLLGMPVRELSLGQRVRCDLAAALLHGPRMVFLDEPTIGLDVAVKVRIRSFVRDLAARQGVAVVLTTHDLGDIEELCERVVLLDKGKVMFDGSLDDLRSRLGGRRTLVVETGRPLSDDALTTLATTVDGEVSRRSATGLEVEFSAQAGVVVQAVMAAVTVEDLTIAEPSMEQIVARLYEERR
jgi:ABC-2 type transport system ATP-binding protein